MRLNLDDQYFTDERFKMCADLLKLGEGEVRWRIQKLWRNCLLKRVWALEARDMAILSGSFAEGVDFAVAMEKAMLAEAVGLEASAKRVLSTFFRINGVEERVKFLLKQSASGRKGGKGKKKTGKALDKQSPSECLTPAKQVSNLSSSSSSPSASSSAATASQQPPACAGSGGFGYAGQDAALPTDLGSAGTSGEGQRIDLAVAVYYAAMGAYVSAGFDPMLATRLDDKLLEKIKRRIGELGSGVQSLGVSRLMGAYVAGARKHATANSDWWHPDPSNIFSSPSKVKEAFAATDDYSCPPCSQPAHEVRAEWYRRMLRAVEDVRTKKAAPSPATGVPSNVLNLDAAARSVPGAGVGATPPVSKPLAAKSGVPAPIPDKHYKPHDGPGWGGKIAVNTTPNL